MHLLLWIFVTACTATPRNVEVIGRASFQRQHCGGARMEFPLKVLAGERIVFRLEGTQHPVKTITSGPDGQFRTRLPPATYCVDIERQPFKACNRWVITTDAAEPRELEISNSCPPIQCVPGEACRKPS